MGFYASPSCSLQCNHCSFSSLSPLPVGSLPPLSRASLCLSFLVPPRLSVVFFSCSWCLCLFVLLLLLLSLSLRTLAPLVNFRPLFLYCLLSLSFCTLLPPCLPVPCLFTVCYLCLLVSCRPCVFPSRYLCLLVPCHPCFTSVYSLPLSLYCYLCLLIPCHPCLTSSVVPFPAT